MKLPAIPQRQLKDDVSGTLTFWSRLGLAGLCAVWKAIDTVSIHRGPKSTRRGQLSAAEAEYFCATPVRRHSSSIQTS